MVIQTGPVQKMSLSNFPICSQYTLQLDIKPTNVDWHCWDNARLPGDLNAISYLGNGNVVHFADEFIVPLSGSQWTTSEAIKFTVTADSFFRVWTEPHEIDIDFYLYESGKTASVASTIALNIEEEIIYRLVAGKTYTLQVIYYRFVYLLEISLSFHRWGQVDPNRCWVFDLELAISPIIGDAPSCSQTSLPASNVIPNYASGSPNFQLNSVYTFDQSDGSLFTKMPFVIADDFIYFR